MFDYFEVPPQPFTPTYPKHVLLKKYSMKLGGRMAELHTNSSDSTQELQ